MPLFAGYSVREVGREMIEYREGDVAYVFDAAWGVRPSIVYIPDAAYWDSVVPESFVGRRDEIVMRMRRSRRLRKDVFEDWSGPTS